MSYTLEKHLELICKDDPDYCILDASWKLNKRSLPIALNNVTINFPHYSLHESSHSQKIIKNIESFLGRSRIEKLGPTETWLILMAAYTHDLGMVIAYTDLEEDWLTENFEQYLVQLSKNKSDLDLANAAELIVKLKKGSEDRFDWTLPLKIRNAVVLISADRFRKVHHVKSSEMLKGKNEKIQKMFSSFYSDLIPYRFLDLLGDIAYSHGINFDYIFTNLHHVENGLSTDKVHPRFIASLLRLGDLLDVDDKRFNQFTIEVMGTGFPTTSKHHVEKHASIRHFLISPTGIEITADCKSQQVYRLARSWFDWLEIEVLNQSKDWTKIAPENFLGLPPVINDGSIKVLFKGNKLDDELINMKFNIKSSKALEIFKGGGIYEEPAFVFIREIVQNALDANKIQLWKDISSGLYDQMICRHLNIKERLETSEIIKKLNFPHQIPSDIYANYQTDLLLNWDADTLTVTVKDKGCGISKEDLLRMTNHVGESKYKTTEYEKKLKSTPYWLKPTGAFGLGLQSVFFVTDSFKVQTKADGEPPIEISFNSQDSGGYSYITESNFTSQSRGTTVIVTLPLSSLPQYLQNRYSVDLIDKYDYFTSEIPIQLSKLISLVGKNLNEIEGLNIFTNGTSIKESLYVRSKDAFNPDFKAQYLEDVYTELHASKGDLHFCSVINDSIVGSYLNLSFFSGRFHTIEARDHNFNYNPPLLVRSIPIEEKGSRSWRFANFFSSRWDLLTPSSDKILDISRRKIDDKSLYDLTDRLRTEVIGKVITNCISILTKSEVWNKINSDFGSFIAESNLFYLSLSAAVNNIEIPDTSLFAGNHNIKSKVFYRLDGTSVTHKNFLDCDEILVIHTGKHHHEGDLDVKSILQDTEMIGRIKPDTIIHDQMHTYSFSRYLEHMFSIVAFEYKDENQIILLKKNVNTYYIEPLSNVIKYTLKNLTVKNEDPKDKNRRKVYAIKPYANKLAVKNEWTGGFDVFPLYSSSCIISPFANYKDVKELFLKVKPHIENKELLDNIKIHIHSVLPEKLINWVIEHNVEPNKYTEKEIVEAYSILICDYFKNDPTIVNDIET